MHSNVTGKNVSWPHFSWTTLYIKLVTIKNISCRYILTMAISIRYTPQYDNSVSAVYSTCNYVFAKQTKNHRICFVYTH